MSLALAANRCHLAMPLRSVVCNVAEPCYFRRSGNISIPVGVPFDALEASSALRRMALSPILPQPFAAGEPCSGEQPLALARALI